jgi:hypothetical protein
VARASLATLLLVLALAAAGCAGDPEPNAHAGQGDPTRGESARERFEDALIATRRAGSASVHEHLVSNPPALEWTITGRTRFDSNEALLDIVHHRHPALAPGTAFHVLIDFASYVRRTDGNWYVPPFNSGEFELAYADLVRLIRRAYGRVETQGSSGFLVWMSRANLERLRMSAEGVGPLGTLYDLIGPMRVELDDGGRIGRLYYEVTGRYFGSLTPDYRVSVTVGFTRYRDNFQVHPPPGDKITPGRLVPPRPKPQPTGTAS